MANVLKNTDTAGRMEHPPRHIAIIMDGNGRWAQKRGLPRTAGHKAGAETFRRIATYCKNIGVQYLTVYAFSTENWKRSADEVGAIMGLLKKYL
ncbi:polyprenyl diphosphate synthase, partial [Dysosmobacter sp.]|uniref:polyprenyl diphosphate synthase n=1 Tax=Dysosmobacter sp. TaxID=2591382 RepID=UPI002A9B2037